jgi:LacI family transcriptional regulator
MRLRTTLQDIAEACGVGKSTVARVLSGNPHVSPETRDLVRAKAEELGYRPDPALRILSQHRWNRNTSSNLTLAVITPHAGKGGTYPPYREAVLASAGRLGYRVEEFPVTKYASTAQLGNVLYNRGIRGLLIPPVVNPIEWNIDWSRFSAVGCGIGEFRLPIHSVDINYFTAFRRCWQECLARGYRRIGACLYRQPGPDQNDSLRYAACLYEQSLLPAGHARIPIFDGGFQDFDHFKRWVRRNRPDAVIALNASVFWVFESMGLSVPDDIGFCLISNHGGSQNKIAGATTQRARVAELAVNWLDQLIRTNETGLPAIPDEILVESSWIEHPTLRPRPPAGGPAPTS